MRLTVTTPDAVVVDVDIASLTAEDSSGRFGIRPGHADLLTVLTPSLLAWRDAGGGEHFAAARGGVLTVRGGTTIAVATREAFAGDDLDLLEARLAESVAAAHDRDARAKGEAAALQAAALRHLQRYLQAAGGR
jgi:F-type H+-transporting ATPase subunit epsilon